MKKLLEMAMDRADQAEVYHLRESTAGISLRNSILIEPESSIQSGYSLRIIRDGMLGTAYTKNLLDRKELVDNAIASLEGGINAEWSFPGCFETPDLECWDGSVEKLGVTDLRDYCRELLDFFDGKVEGQVDVEGGFGTVGVHIVNSSGLDASQELSAVSLSTSLLFPGTETGIYGRFMARKPFEVPRDALERQIDVYRAGLPEVDVPSGRMKVMFTPFSMYALTWRLAAASSGVAFHNGVSPLLEKTGERVLSEKLTIFDDQRDPIWANPRAFDDEGVPARRLDIFENGVFRNVYVNLDYAAKLAIEPTASGYRGGIWGGGETISLQPEPNLRALRIAPGDTPWDSMVASIDRGVIVFGLLGAHSGNILNGDFSVGLSPGLYVEKGKIVGRVRDGMVGGNVYDVLRRVISVEDRPFIPMGMSPHPCVLLDEISVSGRE